MTVHNRTAAATALLAEIDAWCARTGTPAGKIGGLLFRHPGFVNLLRLRLTVSVEKERAVRGFLAEHPNGANDAPVPNPRLRAPRRSARGTERHLVRVVGPICRLCGGEATACSYPSCPHRDAA